MTTEIRKTITGKEMTTAFFDNDKNNGKVFARRGLIARKCY